MYCSSCGQEVNDGTKFCPYCGNELKVEEINNNKPSKVYSVFANIGKVFSIVAIASCWLPLFSLVLAAPGIVFSAIGKKSRDEEKIKSCKKSITRCIVGAVISFIIFIFIFVLVILGAIEVADSL